LELHPPIAPSLFLGFLVHGMLSAGLAELFVLQFLVPFLAVSHQ